MAGLVDALLELSDEDFTFFTPQDGGRVEIRLSSELQAELARRFLDSDPMAGTFTIVVVEDLGTTIPPRP